jgi:hypothetical protein
VEGRALRNLGNPLFNSRVPNPAEARFLGDERRLIEIRNLSSNIGEVFNKYYKFIIEKTIIVF